MAAGERKLPTDPNYWLLMGICLFGFLSLVGLTLTVLGVLSAHSWVHVVLLLGLPGAGFVVVFGLQFGSREIRFHPVMLIGFLIVIALAMLVYLNFVGIL